jgi:hypothetical protein
VSDATGSAGGADELRPSKEQRRADETVMIGSDNLEDLVSQAKEPAQPAAQPAAPQPAAVAQAGGGSNTALIVVAVIALAVIVGVVLFVVLGG